MNHVYELHDAFHQAGFVALGHRAKYIPIDHHHPFNHELWSRTTKQSVLYDLKSHSGLQVFWFVLSVNKGPYLSVSLQLMTHRLCFYCVLFDFWTLMWKKYIFGDQNQPKKSTSHGITSLIFLLVMQEMMQETCFSMLWPSPFGRSWF